MTDDATTPGLADQVLELLRAGRDDDLWALFDRSFQETVSRSDVEQARTSMEDAMGSLVAVGEPLKSQTRGATLYDYPLAYEDGAGHLQVAIRRATVAGLLLLPGGPTGRWNRSSGRLRRFLRRSDIPR